MAQNKKTTSKTKTSAKKSFGKKSQSSSKGKNTKKQPAKTKADSRRTKILVLCLVEFFFLVISFIGNDAKIWNNIRAPFFALFGVGIYIFNIVLIAAIVILALNRNKRSGFAYFLSGFGIVASICSFVTVAFTEIAQYQLFSDLFSDVVSSSWNIPFDGIGAFGGIIGGLIGGFGLLYLGKIPSAILLVLLFLISVVIFFSIPVMELVKADRQKTQEELDEIEQKRAEARQRQIELREIKRQQRRAEEEARRIAEMEERQRQLKQQQEENQRRYQNLSADPAYNPVGPITPFPWQNDDYNNAPYDTASAYDNVSNSYDTFEHEGDDEEYDDIEEESNENTSTSSSVYSKVTIPSGKRNRKNGGSVYRVLKSDEEEQNQAIDDYSNDDYINQQSFVNDDSTADSDAFAEEEQQKEENAIAEVNIDEDTKDIIMAAAESSREYELTNRSQTKHFKEDRKDYLTPPIDCLDEPKFDGELDTESEMKEISVKLIDTLKSFGVETKMVGASRGPSVTRYELQPAMGVRINKITNLSDDIALNLAASGIRIEAPIPGKSAVGIEIPNKVRASVSLREIISSDIYIKAAQKSKLSVAIGKDIAGQVNCADLAKMPHLLVAGTTGSGKSVTMNDMIISLLYNASPDEVKLLLIDPKTVEFSVYNGIPHLFVPVITDAKKASGALTWAVTEMERRYKLFSICGVRDLKSYNDYIKKNPDPDDIMHVEPQVVIFIDELADLMMVSPKEVEDSICRLAQKARAAGMHLVVATQRPSVDVVTGLIKANIPSRLALSVSSQVDSRTILDVAGAEKLLGYGDLLFNPLGVSKPIRIQGAFVSEEEIERIVAFLREKALPDYDNNVLEQIEKYALETGNKKGSSGGSDDVKPSGGNMDPLFDEVLKFACENGEISGSLIMRKFSLGYGRSAKILDQMLERGYVGEVNTSTKKRPVLISISQYWELKNQQSSSAASSSDEQINMFDSSTGNSDDNFDILSGD